MEDFSARRKSFLRLAKACRGVSCYSIELIFHLIELDPILNSEEQEIFFSSADSMRYSLLQQLTSAKRRSNIMRNFLKALDGYFDALDNKSNIPADVHLNELYDILPNGTLDVVGPLLEFSSTSQSKQDESSDGAVNQLIVRQCISWLKQHSKAEITSKVLNKIEALDIIITQIRTEMVMISFRIITVIYDLLIPASEIRDKAEAFQYRRWGCEIYRMLVEEDRLLISEFNVLVGKHNKKAIPIKEDAPLAVSRPVGVAPGSLFDACNTEDEIGGYSTQTRMELPCNFIGTRLMYGLTSISQGGDIRVRLRRLTQPDTSLLQHRSEEERKCIESENTPVKSASAPKFYSVLPHHHSYRYPAIEGPQNVVDMYLELLEESEFYLHPHNPTRAAIVFSAADYIAYLQNYTLAFTIVDQYLADVLCEAKAPFPETYVMPIPCSAIRQGSLGCIFEQDLSDKNYIPHKILTVPLATGSKSAADTLITLLTRLKDTHTSLKDKIEEQG